MIDFAAQRTGKIDILVNNAGWDRIRPFMKTDPDFWDRVIRINYRGVLNTVFEACRIMCGQDNGRIINIASDAALVGSMGEAVYVTGQVLSVSGGLTMSS